MNQEHQGNAENLQEVAMNRMAYRIELTRLREAQRVRVRGGEAVFPGAIALNDLWVHPVFRRGDFAQRRALAVAV